MRGNCYKALEIIIIQLLKADYHSQMITLNSCCLFVCLYFTSLQQRGHLETEPPFTVS